MTLHSYFKKSGKGVAIFRFLLLVLLQRLVVLLPVIAQTADVDTVTREERIARVREIRAELERRRSLLSQASFLKDNYLLESRVQLHQQVIPSTAQLVSPMSSTVGSLSATRTHSLFEELMFHQKSIYGRFGDADNRVELIKVRNPIVRQNMESVAALVGVANVITNGNGTITLRTTNYMQRYGLCEDERFALQPTVAYGTAFLVGTQTMVTAGHCVQAENVPAMDQILVVFGFRMKSLTSAQTNIPLQNIYKVKRVVARHYDTNGADWAVIEIDRASTLPPLKIRRSGSLSNQAPTYVIGYPCGLPIKFADEGKVTMNQFDEFFFATLDAYGGNSGSPVFGADHLVEGILVRGKPDFENLSIGNGKSCKRSLIWPDTGPDGEVCTRISQLARHIPELPTNALLE